MSTRKTFVANRISGETQHSLREALILRLTQKHARGSAQVSYLSHSKLFWPFTLQRKAHKQAPSNSRGKSNCGRNWARWQPVRRTFEIASNLSGRGILAAMNFRSRGQNPTTQNLRESEPKLLTHHHKQVETKGVEPSTPALQRQCSPN